MKIILILGCILLVLTSFVGSSSTQAVYLCDSPGGKKYHLNEKCRGLSNCQRKIVSTTLEKAKKAGKTL